MSEKKMILDIVSVQSQVFSGEVTFIQATGSQGELGIYPGHTALITSVKPGQVVTTDTAGEEHVFFIAGGVMEIQPDNVTILSDTAIRADDLDEASALAIKENKHPFEISKMLGHTSIKTTFDVYGHLL